METHRAMNDLADAIDPRKLLDTSSTGQPGIAMWCPSAADLIAASDALRSMVKRLEMLTPRNPHIRPGNTE